MNKRRQNGQETTYMYRISHVDELFLLQTAPTAHGRRGHGYAVWIAHNICINTASVSIPWT